MVKEYLKEYLNLSRLWKKFLEETGLSEDEAIKIEDDGSYMGTEPHPYGPTFIIDEDKRKIVYGDKILNFSIITWPYPQPYKKRMELHIKYNSKEEVIQILS